MKLYRIRRKMLTLIRRRISGQSWASAGLTRKEFKLGCLMSDWLLPGCLMPGWLGLGWFMPGCLVPDWLVPAWLMPDWLQPGCLVPDWLIMNLLMPGWLRPGWLITGCHVPGWLLPGWHLPSCFMLSWFMSGKFVFGWFMSSWFVPNKLVPGWLIPGWFTSGKLDCFMPDWFTPSWLIPGWLRTCWLILVGWGLAGRWWVGRWLVGQWLCLDGAGVLNYSTVVGGFGMFLFFLNLICTLRPFYQDENGGNKGLPKEDYWCLWFAGVDLTSNYHCRLGWVSGCHLALLCQQAGSEGKKKMTLGGYYCFTPLHSHCVIVMKSQCSYLRA